MLTKRMYSLLLLFAIINVVNCILFPVFIRYPGAIDPIQIDVDSDGTIGDVKTVLQNTNSSTFSNSNHYVIKLQNPALTDDALLSDSGISAESTLDIEFLGPNVRNLRSAGFNQTEIEYFTDILNICKYNGDVHAIFWAQDNKFHFIKRSSNNQYCHYCYTLLDQTGDLREFIVYRRLSKSD